MSDTDLAVLKAVFEKHERESKARSRARNDAMAKLERHIESQGHIVANTSLAVEGIKATLQALSTKLDEVAKKQDEMVAPLTLAKAATNGCQDHKKETAAIQNKLAYLSGRNVVIAALVLLVLNIASGVVGSVLTARVLSQPTQEAKP